jgi:GT2 family glycosyltransferase/glycosyltransferase involved in cell wall biosynthesis
VQAAVDIIVPAYRGPDETRRCVESVLSSTCRTPYELVVIDDCSPDPALTRWLREKAAGGRFTLLENATNLGFVATANRGMALHHERDVVLLNNDTEVANDWLDRLAACAGKDPLVATVTPFSNNATICSYPFEGWGGGLPGRLGLAALDRLFALTNAGRSVDLPTAVGFCMYIRRACLVELGLFDVDRFGRGYGEENDFCMRAAKAGWRNLLAADVFVFHEGGVSFTDERRALQDAAMAALLQAHPEYLDKVRDFVRRDPLAPLRAAINDARSAAGAEEQAAVEAERALRAGRSAKATDALSRPARLHITHSWGGGTGRWVSDYCKGDSGRRSLVLHSCTDRNSAGYRLELLDPAAAPSPLMAWQLTTPVRTTDIGHPEYRAILRDVIAVHGVCDIVVSSLIGHAFDALDTGLPTAVVLHDLHPFCPALFACFGSPCSQCAADRLQHCLQSNPYNVFWHNSTARHWLGLRDEYAARIRQPWIVVAAPTDGIRDRWAALLPAMAELTWHRIPHGLDPAQFAAAGPARPASNPQAKLRIVVPGRLAPHKGLQLLRRVLPELLTMADVLLLGCGDFGRLFADTTGVQIVPQYAHAELGAEIERFAPDCALLLSVLPESFSYTLSEMSALGLPVLATRLGAFAERIEQGKTGLLFEPQAGALLACVREVSADRRVLTSIAANLAALPLRGVADMVRDYDALLSTLPAGAPGVVATAPVRPAADDDQIGIYGTDRERIRAEVRGTFYLPDAVRIVFGSAPSAGVAAARLAQIAWACTSARNDVCVFLSGSAPEEALVGRATATR